ncbi:MAG: GspE/PulE family protein [Myxococcota bacterium]
MASRAKPEAAEADGLAALLVERGAVTPEQIAYADRVRSKLPGRKPIAHVLSELEILGERELQATLKTAPVELSLQQLAIGLGLLDADTWAQAEDLANEATDPKRSLVDVLLDEGFVGEDALVGLQSLRMGCGVYDAERMPPDRTLVAAVPHAWCRRHRLLPIRRDEASVTIAFADYEDRVSRDAARRLFPSLRVDPLLARPSQVEELWERLAGTAVRDDLPGSHESAIVREVDAMILAAIERDASDIHVEPQEGRLRIRFREDGVLVPYRDLPSALTAPFTTRLKVLCSTDIAERRRHQGGRLTYEAGGRELDLRVSFYVTVHGEKAVLRILNRSRSLQPLDEIGMPPRTLQRFKEDALERPSGVILVTGPTGSGKTSTLYSSVHHINHDGLAITTAEDPVEYLIEGISQCSLNPEIDLTYDETLRHMVRQDPDVIVIGEIRDQNSAGAAIQAALTGHKVITTFHTEDTIGGLVRLLNMEIEAFLISSTVVSVLAQRLVRKICSKCSEPYTLTAADHRRLGLQPDQLEGAEMRIGRGCGACRGSGYRGRIAIFELLVLGEEVRDAILDHKTSYEIRRISREQSGLVSLFEDGLVKAAQGLTTVSELYRMLPRLDVPRPLPELWRMVGK